MSQLNVLPNSDVVLVCFDAQENKWILYDVYKVALGYALEVSVLGWINGQTNDEHLSEDGFQLNREYHNINSRKNLKGVHLPCGSLVS